MKREINKMLRLPLSPSDLQTELQYVQTVPGNIPLERAVAARRICNRCIGEVDWLRNDLRLVVDVVVRVQISASQDRAIDRLVLLRHVHSQWHRGIEYVDDFHVNGVFLVVNRGNPEQRVEVSLGVRDGQSLVASVVCK